MLPAVAGGVKVTATPTDWPGASTVPTAGSPVTEKGAAGEVVPVIVNGDEVLLRNDTALVAAGPSAASVPKSTLGGVAPNGTVAAWPVPARGTLTAPPLVVSVNVPVCPPMRVGV